MNPNSQTTVASLSKIFDAPILCLRLFRSIAFVITVLLILSSETASAQLNGLPLFEGDVTKKVDADYLIKRIERKAGVYRRRGDTELVMDNGLLRRVWRLEPNAACVRFDNLVTGKTMLRAVRPEAAVWIDGVQYDIGGLTGQPNHAFLLPEWLDKMKPIPGAMVYKDFSVSKIKPRLKWKRVRHHAGNAQWPPQGVHLKMNYQLNPKSSAEDVIAQTHQRLLLDPMTKRTGGWKVYESKRHPRSNFENEGKFGEIYTPVNTAVFADHSLPAGSQIVETKILLGTDKSASWAPGIGLVWRRGNREQVLKFNVRTGDNLFSLSDGKREWNKGGRHDSESYRLRMALTKNQVICFAKTEGRPWEKIGTIARPVDLGDPAAFRVGKMDRLGGNKDFQDPGKLARLKIDQVIVYGKADPVLEKKFHSQQNNGSSVDPITVTVHYEMYDGIPLMSKWITVQNGTSREIVIDRFTSEMLAMVEKDSWVAAPRARHKSGVSPVVIPKPDYLHVVSDFSFGGGEDPALSNHHVVHWREDPKFTSQVNYAKKTPCLLVVQPDLGPNQRVAPGDSFESCRVFELAYENDDRERRGLAQRRMYRTISPWISENPLVHHLPNANPNRVKRAIDQAAEIGFEMIVLSFGSGFNIENDDKDYLKKWKSIADYAKAKGIELGAYGLLSSRRVGGGNDVVLPKGQRPHFGNSPCLCSQWGENYFKKLYNFFDQTGFTVLSHDGNYPGDPCVAKHHPGHLGHGDSQWNQWRKITDFYRYARGKGIYLNVPDRYFLNGANKCGMGYREVNWSLPRAHQVIHTRQNIYDGTWKVTPSMGWMFVPLTEYHGGGPAATVEPLDKHLDHYERMILSNLGMGVQAHFRGPQMYDTPRTRDMLVRNVKWFKTYREILESDLIHGRRADGQDIDWMLHANPFINDKGMLVVYNPLKKPVTRTIRVNLYYTGISDQANVFKEGRDKSVLKLARDYSVEIQVEVPAEGMTWYLIR